MVRRDSSFDYPKRCDYLDHIEWFLEKNPAKSRDEAILFARSQIGHQIAINHMNVRMSLAAIKESLQEIETMARMLEKGEGTSEWKMK